MRVCPKCGYVDPPEWRHSRYSYWIDHCKTEDFKKLHPTLAERLLNGEKLVEDDINVYRMTKTGYVERKAKVDYGNQFDIPMENKRTFQAMHDGLKAWYKTRLNLKGIRRKHTQTKLLESEKHDRKSCVGGGKNGVG